MSGLFRKVPLRDNYKDVPDDIVRLKAPPNISRMCFIFEISVAAAAFALSFYISFTSTVSVTSITYEPLGSSYVCKVLSPRSDTLSFSTKTNEMVGFSSARFLLDECLTVLDSSGLNVCADNNREDYLLEVSGVSARDENCLDIILKDNYRFCYGAETAYKIVSESFPIGSSRPTTAYVSPFYYFMNGSSTVQGFTAPLVSLLSDWVAYNNTIHVVATTMGDNRAGLFKFEPTDGSTSKDVLTAPVAMARIDIGGSTVIGFAIADDLVHVWTINSQNSMGTLYTLGMDTEVVVSHTYDCTNFADTSYQYGGSAASSVFRYLAASDGYVYAMCGKNVWSGAYTFYQINTATYASVKLHTDIESLTIDKQGTASNDSVNTVSTLFVRDNFAYFSTGEPTFNLLRVDLSPQPTPVPTSAPTVLPSAVPSGKPSPSPPTLSPAPPPGPPPGARRHLQHAQLAETISISSEGLEEVLPPAPPASGPSNNWILQPVVNLGFCEGSSLSQGFGNTVYLSSTSAPFASRYYNITSGQFEQYETLREDYFLATAVEVGYSFAVCNGKVLNVSVDPTISTDYKDKCDSINGIYYQNNHYYAMPTTCAHLFDPSVGAAYSADTLQQCAAISTLKANYTATNCAASFDKICSAAYTDNPPFSCTTNLRPDFLTTLGSALSNAGALWSLIAVLISISLRRVYPGGVLARLYDPKDGQLKSEKLSGRGSGGNHSNGRSATVHPIHEDEELASSKLEKADSFKQVEQGGQVMRDRGKNVEEGDTNGDNRGSGTVGTKTVIGGASEDPLVSNNSNKTSNNNISQKPTKRQDEEEEDGCCVMLLDECQC